MRRVVRDQLGHLVHLAERQAQHAPHVTHRGTRLQLAEGDDLRHAIGAVFLAHIVDHRVAAFLAEVDVEVRHRHALGVEEALEQQVEADRIEIGDGKRPGHHGSRAGTAARTHRNALRLRPLDEVGNDQEIAGKAHRDDDGKLVVQAFAITRAGCGVGAHRIHAAIEAFDRHGAHGLLLGAARAHLGRDRQQRFAHLHHHRAAPRDGERVVAGLRQIGEQHAHVRRRLEPMLRRHAPALAFRQQASIRDRQQRVMRLVHARRGEVAVVGGNQRHAERVRQRDQPGFERAFAGDVVAVQFHRHAVGKRFHELREQAFGLRLLPLREQARQRSGGTAGQQDQPGGMRADRVQPELRLQAGIGLQEAARRQAPEIVEAGGVLRQQHDRVRRQARIVGAGERDLAADDRLDALGGAGLAELQRAEQVGGVGDRHRRHVRVVRQGGDFFRLDGALAERVGGMHAQVDEIGMGHGGIM